MNEEHHDNEERHDEDLDMVNRCKKGDESAFVELYHKYYRRFYKYAYWRYFYNEYWAEECAIKAMIKIAISIDKFKGKSKFSTWAYQIIKNECINTLNSGEYKRWKNIDPLDSIHDPNDDRRPKQYPDNKRNTNDDIDENEIRRLVKLILDKLKEKNETYWNLIIMFWFEGLSYKEIADILNISMDKVKSGLHRAKKMLYYILKEMGLDDMP